MLAWYEANQANLSFLVGSFPFGVAFDGVNVWAADMDDNNVMKK